ncbi:hypothetical protein BJ742DRAFT_802467 [Cladochytrium replicatum]|nr:hypothetical protein BJ742DRAFT_802467 [Cladochytrium replicatum]
MRSSVSTVFLIALLACSSLASADDGSLSKQLEQKFGVPHRLEKRATDVLPLNATETYILFRITAPSSSNYIYSYVSTIPVSTYILSSTQYLAYTPTVAADNTISAPLSFQTTCSPCQRVTTCPSTTCAFTAGTWYVVIISPTPATGLVTYTDNISSATSGTGGSGSGGSGTGGTGTSPSPLAVSPASSNGSSSSNGNSNNSNSDSGLSLGAIIGIAVGGVVVVVGAVIGVLLVRRNKKPAAAANTVAYTPAAQQYPPPQQYAPPSQYSQYDPRASYNGSQPGSAYPSTYQPASPYPATSYQPAAPYPATTYQPTSPYPSYSVPPPPPKQ